MERLRKKDEAAGVVQAPLTEAQKAAIAEIRRLIGISALDAMGYFLLGIVVLVIASLCMLTSRIGVYRILNVRQ